VRVLGNTNKYLAVLTALGVYLGLSQISPLWNTRAPTIPGGRGAMGKCRLRLCKGERKSGSRIREKYSSRGKRVNCGK
jgi:hypothetical protein